MNTPLPNRMNANDPLSVVSDSQWIEWFKGVSAKLTGSPTLFEVDVDGGLMPVTTVVTIDPYYELDGNGDIQPRS